MLRKTDFLSFWESLFFVIPLSHMNTKKKQEDDGLDSWDFFTANSKLDIKFKFDIQYFCNQKLNVLFKPEVEP